MDCEFTEQPDAHEIDYLTDKINCETPDYGAATPFAFYMRDDTGELIAGANGFIIFGSIYTDQLWVAPEYREQGKAMDLMERIHHYGLKHGCTMATVQTMSFQGAQVFYEKLGYEVDFERDGYSSESRLLFMIKIL